MAAYIVLFFFGGIVSFVLGRQGAFLPSAIAHNSARGRGQLGTAAADRFECMYIAATCHRIFALGCKAFGCGTTAVVTIVTEGTTVVARERLAAVIAVIAVIGLSCFLPDIPNALKRIVSCKS